MPSIPPPATDTGKVPRRDGVDTAVDIIQFCLRQPELVAEFDRLSGTSLGKSRTPLDAMIDEATGSRDRQLQQFAAFVVECVITPLVLQSLASPGPDGEAQ